MDFFQFLQKSTDDSDNSKKTKRKTKTTREYDTFNSSSEEFTRRQGNQTEESSQTYDITKKREMEQTHLYIKRGDMVRIVNVPNSMLNIYKGYIGEIKDYKIDHDSALVFLHGITSITFIKFPLVHLIKIP
jgi:hypothetical protein